MAWHPDSVSAGQHQAGTCRMGNDPRSSVVTRNCQLHDVDNVFVIDGSVHVTSTNAYSGNNGRAVIPAAINRQRQ